MYRMRGWRCSLLVEFMLTEKSSKKGKESTQYDSTPF
jgi:hypothetical protein